jgi:hypothetical protein
MSRSQRREREFQQGGEPGVPVDRPRPRLGSRSELRDQPVCVIVNDQRVSVGPCTIDTVFDVRKRALGRHDDRHSLDGVPGLLAARDVRGRPDVRPGWIKGRRGRREY